ncbi:protein FAR1-RELATED SEQUENCE 11-like [Silene latifolia]|uniref:protein FAR1-RELATED SEQUENCE 11-like n=1 Tax=Silene latifolia TaxID=37657 RepID=UPI003D76EDC9
MLDFDLNEPIIEEDDEPLLGQTFESQEEAFVFYNNYAKRQGFVAAKYRTDNKHGRTIRQDFICHRAGKQRLKVIDMSKTQRKKQSSKCGCPAHMRITLKRRFDIFPEEWHVTTFVKEHNHEMLLSEELRFLPANRNITAEDEKRILMYKEAGLSIRQIIRVFELEKNIKHGELPFFDRDIRNLYGKVKKMIGADDAKNLMEYMKLAKQENKMFQYAYTLDEKNKLENIFWCHAESFEWYQKFGDVVGFDTTYRVNIYDMICGIFVGIDNHGKTVLLGFALLRNETTPTFKWLMKTFVSIMKKPPNSIITDQDPWMSEAILTEMPTTKHSYCIWHITSKFSCWFAGLLRYDYQEWCSEFYKLYRMTELEEFENNWFVMVEKFNLQNNKHVLGLYKVRQFWAPAYLHNYFFGGMITTGRSESINAFIKRFVSSHTCLTDFVKQVEMAVQEIRQGRSNNKVVATMRPVPLNTQSPLEKQAAHVLTPFALKKFQEEFGRSASYTICQVDCSEFIVKYFEGDNARQHRVFWDGDRAICSCKNFEFWGIICRHMLRVFVHTDCFNIPSFYFPQRWHCDALQNTTNIEEVVDEVSIGGEDVVLCPPQSKTKGRPRNKRDRSGKEMAMKKTKCCSICKKSGHTKPTCPNKENFFTQDVVNDEGVSSTSQKKKKTTAEDMGLNPVFTLKI